MHIASNKTHLSNVVFAKSARPSIRFLKLLNSSSELHSLIFWGTVLLTFGPKYRTDGMP